MPGFDPRPHLTSLKGKPYLEVKYRLLWLTEEQPHYTIETEPITLTDQLAIFKATITTYDEDGALLRRATGTKSETPRGFADYVEKSETGSIGRALGALGYGTQYAVEHEGEAEALRPVDSPVNSMAAARAQPAEPTGPDRATEPQKRAIFAISAKKWGTNAEAAANRRLLMRALYQVESSNDLTRAQASSLIKYLGETAAEDIEDVIVELAMADQTEPA